jgi:hypothetical protein
VDRPIVEPGGPQSRDIIRRHRGRRAGELVCVDEERPIGRLEAFGVELLDD